MTLETAVRLGIPFSGCEICDQVVVLGDSSAQQIADAWKVHVAGEVHRNGGVQTPEPAVNWSAEDLSPRDMPVREFEAGNLDDDYIAAAPAHYEYQSGWANYLAMLTGGRAQLVAVLAPLVSGLLNRSS